VNTSTETDEIATALAKAQAAMEGAKKDAANPFYKSKYADLQSVWDACRKALTDNGLSIAQVTGWVGETFVLHTRLLHTSGQWIAGDMPIRCKDDTPQAMGSAITYARRYALAAIVGVYQTDDDAEAAQGRAPASNGAMKAPEEQSSHERAAYTKSVSDYRARVIEQLNKGNLSAAADIMTEAKDSSEEFALDVWRGFTSPIKQALRDIAPRKTA